MTLTPGEKLEQILTLWAKHFEPATHTTGRYGMPRPSDVVDWQLTISKEGWKFHKNELRQALADFIEKEARKVIGEYFTEVTEYDRAINGVIKMQEQRLKKLVEGLRK